MLSVTITHRILFFLFFAGSMLISCRKNKTTPTPPTVPPSLNKTITAFEFRQTDNNSYLYANIAGIVGTDTIKIIFPAETDISNLKPLITFTGKSVTPASGVSRNFSSSLTYSVKAEDGSEKSYTVVASYRKTVFISSNDGYLYALDGLNGQVIWQSANSNFYSLSSQAVTNGMVYGSATDGIYALDAKNGTQKWKLSLPAPINYELLPGPMVVNNILYMGAWDGFVYALNASTGTILWKTASSTGKSFFANVSVNNNNVYAGCMDSSLYALNITTGNINWKFDCHGSIYKNPLLINNKIYIGGLANHFYAINAGNGTEVWDYPYHFVMSSPIYYDGRIYCGGGSEAWGLDTATGNIQWHVTYSLPPGMYSERSGPAIENGILYAGSINKKVYAWNINTGTLAWTAETFNYIYSSPVVVEGIVYIGSNDGYIYALDAATGAQVWKKSTTNGVSGSACVVDSKGVRHYSAVSGYSN
jgi:eukaryotic-like serine/threonine-protein kinase